MKYCFLDLETTGLDHEKDSILEISFFLQDEDGTKGAIMDEVVIPTKTPLIPYVTHLTGITPEEVQTKGVELSLIVAKAAELIGDAVIVGHNIDFDIRFLVENGIDVSKNQRIDTHELARISLLNEESYALEILAEKYRFAHHSAHRAMSDVEASAELFVFLKEKIAELPIGFFEKVKPFLETKTKWAAKDIFLEIAGSPSFALPKKEPSTPADFPIPEDFWNSFGANKEGETLFVEQGESVPSSAFLRSVAQKLDKPSLIVSPKLDFFPGIMQFPTPEVIFAPDRFEEYITSKKEFNNSETAFIVKCFLRHFLKFRGVDKYHLFAGERDLWTHVCIEKEEHPVFQDILKERTEEKIISITPDAYFRFRHTDCLASRVLLVDEAEVFAEKLLFAPAQNFSLFRALKNEETSIAAQFLVTGVCRDIIEPTLQHSMSPFPQKVLLPPHAKYPEFSQRLRELSADFAPLAEALENPAEGLERWVNYFPQSGSLSFGLWHPDGWKDLKKELQSSSSLFLYRHPQLRTNNFARIFLARDKEQQFKIPELLLDKIITVPEKLESANSPEFNHFCAGKIQELLGDVDEDNNLLVNISSQETLKKIFSEVSENTTNKEIKLVGESASGGLGKVFQFIKQNKSKVFFSQKFIAPDLVNEPFVKIVVLRFPFSPPHPLFEALKTILATSNVGSWDAWTVPQVTANLSRRLSTFPKAKEILWLDPRQNANWGRGILKELFSNSKKNAQSGS
jgi:DNA polymerase III epsilon subunit-like protein